ncbi:hypothetical protein [Amycolatopsis japonica]
MTEQELDPVLLVAALRVLADYTRECYNAAKVDQAARMHRGDRLTARSPLEGGRKIAALSVTDPKPVTQIRDRAAFTAWVKKNYPDAVKRTRTISGSEDEVVKVLFAHAPHLLRREVAVDPEFEREIKQASAGLGAPLGPNGETDLPGVVVEAPDPQVRCTVEDDALAEVIHLFRVGRLSLDSFQPPELPGGAA